MKIQNHLVMFRIFNRIINWLTIRILSWNCNEKFFQDTLGSNESPAWNSFMSIFALWTSCDYSSMSNSTSDVRVTMLTKTGEIQMKNTLYHEWICRQGDDLCFSFLVSIVRLICPYRTISTLFHLFFLSCIQSSETRASKERIMYS